MPLDNVPDRELNPPSFYKDSLWEDAIELCYVCDEEIEEPIKVTIGEGTKAERKVFVCKKCN